MGIVTSIEALNVALRLGARLRDLPVGSVAVIHWEGSVAERPYVVRVDDHVTLENIKLLQVVTVTTVIIRYDYERFTVPPGEADGVTADMVIEVRQLPDDWSGNPMDLLG